MLKKLRMNLSMISLENEFDTPSGMEASPKHDSLPLMVVLVTNNILTKHRSNLPTQYVSLKIALLEPNICDDDEADDFFSKNDTFRETTSCSQCTR